MSITSGNLPNNFKTKSLSTRDNCRRIARPAAAGWRYQLLDKYMVDPRSRFSSSFISKFDCPEKIGCLNKLKIRAAVVNT